MSKSFSAQVDEMIAMTEKRTNALLRESVQRTINDAQTPTAKGGKMRVDTGFLRASGQISYNGMPTGPVRGDKTEPNSYKYDQTGVQLKLGQFTVGKTLFFGWTAGYAKYRELYDGFLGAAVQKWPQTVAKVTEDIKKRIRR